MAWCFSTRASVATVLTTHPCVSRCSGVKVSWSHFMSFCCLYLWQAFIFCHQSYSETVLVLYYISLITQFRFQVSWHSFTYWLGAIKPLSESMLTKLCDVIWNSQNQSVKKPFCSYYCIKTILLLWFQLIYFKNFWLPYILEIGHNHGCWWPGFVYCQVISSCGTNYVE